MKLTHLQARLPHEVLLLVLGRVRVMQVSDEPGAELIGCLLGQVSAPLPLLAVIDHSAYARHHPAHTTRPHLRYPHVVLVMVWVSAAAAAASIAVGSRGKGGAVKGVDRSERKRLDSRGVVMMMMVMMLVLLAVSSTVVSAIVTAISTATGTASIAVSGGWAERKTG